MHVCTCEECKFQDGSANFPGKSTGSVIFIGKKHFLWPFSWEYFCPMTPVEGYRVCHEHTLTDFGLYSRHDSSTV